MIQLQSRHEGNHFFWFEAPYVAKNFNIALPHPESPCAAIPKTAQREVGLGCAVMRVMK